MSRAPSSSWLLHPQQKPNWGTLPECTPRSLSISACPCQTQTSTTTYTNTHRQYNHSRYRKQHHQTPTIEINGNAVFLVIRRWNATILQILLPTRPWKLKWLSVQTSYCRHTSTRQTLLIMSTWTTLSLWGLLTNQQWCLSQDSTRELTIPYRVWWAWTRNTSPFALVGAGL
jgi:hypothetical protein